MSTAGAAGAAPRDLRASGFDPGLVSTRSWLGLLYLITFGSLIGFVSYGCFRMLNEDVVDLFDRVFVGTPVIVER